MHCRTRGTSTVGGDGTDEADALEPGERGGGLALAPAPRPLSGPFSGCWSSAFLMCSPGGGATSAPDGGVWALEVRATAATSPESATTPEPRTIEGARGRFAAALTASSCPTPR